jgi:hypothetical protein
MLAKEERSSFRLAMPSTLTLTRTGGWPRLNSEKRFWVAYPLQFCFVPACGGQAKGGQFFACGYFSAFSLPLYLVFSFRVSILRTPRTLTRWIFRSLTNKN